MQKEKNNTTEVSDKETIAKSKFFCLRFILIEEALQHFTRKGSHYKHPVSFKPIPWDLEVYTSLRKAISHDTSDVIYDNARAPPGWGWWRRF